MNFSYESGCPNWYTDLEISLDTPMASPDMTTIFYAWLYGRFIKIQSNLRRKKLHRTNQGSNFLGEALSNRDNVRAPIQFREENHPQHPKIWFFLKNRPIHFHINSTSVIILVKQNHLIFSSTEINKPLPALVHSSPQCAFIKIYPFATLCWVNKDHIKPNKFLQTIRQYISHSYWK